jgi:hypothetical protein
MFQQIALGSALVLITTLVHTGCMMAAIRFVKKSNAGVRSGQSRWTREAMIAVFVLLMFYAAILDVSVWAVAYLAVGAMPSFEPALYFSTVTFTSLGYGDIVLNDGWRLLAALESANGVMIFGWTTALIFAIVQRVYWPPPPADDT